MTSTIERERLRADLGATAASLSDTSIDELLAEATEVYDVPAAQQALARVIGLRRLLAQAAKDVDYTENRSGERAGQRYLHYARLITYWEEQVSAALRAAHGGARLAALRRQPTRLEDYPEGA